jgi:hypothetical protein
MLIDEHRNYSSVIIEFSVDGHIVNNNIMWTPDRVSLQLVQLLVELRCRAPTPNLPLWSECPKYLWHFRLALSQDFADERTIVSVSNVDEFFYSHSRRA